MDARVVGTARRAPIALLGVAAAAAALLLADVAVTASTGGFDTEGWWYTAGFMVAMGGLVVAALAVQVRRHHPDTAMLLAVTAALGTASDLLGALQGPGPAGFLQGPIESLYVAVYAHVLLRYPEHRVRSPIGRILLALNYTLVPAMALLWQVLWDPRWFGAAARGWWWWTIAPERDVSTSVWEAQQLVTVALILALIGVMVARVVGARGRLRHALTPVAAVSVLLGAATVLELVRGLGADLGVVPDLVQVAALIALPVVVIVSLLGEDPDLDPVPARRADARVRERYRLVFAAGSGVLVVLVVVSLVTARAGGEEQTGPAPTPGPALVADP